MVGAAPALLATPAGRLAGGVPNAEKLGWRVGVQAYTFKNFTLFEAIDMVASLGLKYIETCGIPISPDDRTRFDSGITDAQKQRVRAKLKSAGLKLTSHYSGLSDNSLAFCQSMGMEMIITDPRRVTDDPDRMARFDAMARRHKVEVALTNHPRPAPYWNPDLVLEDCSGRSRWIGASCDFGHFMRGGYAPRDAVRRYLAAGRMLQFHFRDVSELGAAGRDVPLGQGRADIMGILEDLHRARARPLFQLEYEAHFDDPMVDLVPSVNYFNEACGHLLRR